VVESEGLRSANVAFVSKLVAETAHDDLNGTRKMTKKRSPEGVLFIYLEEFNVLPSVYSHYDGKKRGGWVEKTM
jgi:hypothetical protein